jgi:anti-sigma factor RsiW
MYDCHTVLRLLYPYLDGELDIKESLRVQCHLEECYYCREVFKHEKEFLQALKASIFVPPAPEHLREKIAQSLKPPIPVKPEMTGGKKRFPYAFPGSLLAASVATLMVIVAGLLVSLEFKKNGLVKAAVQSHVAITQGEDPCDIRSTDPDVIVSWLQDRLDFPVVLPQEKLPAMRLICGKLVHLSNQEKGALFRFASEHGPVTLVETAPKPIKSSEKAMPVFGENFISKGKEIDFEGIIFYFDEYSGRYTLFWADPKLNYALVSDQKESIAEACQICHIGTDREKTEGFKKIFFKNAM